MRGETDSHISYVIAILGVLAFSIFAYVMIHNTATPIKYKHFPNADYEFWFDGNSLESTGTVDKNLTASKPYTFTDGYDYEGVNADSEALRVSDGGRYSAITVGLFVYLDGTEKTVLKLHQRNNVFFRIYTDDGGRSICLRTDYYGTQYTECFTGLDLNEWHAVALRWGSGYDVEFYLDDLNNVKYVPYDGSSLRVNSIRIGGYVDEIKIFFDYVSDSTLSQVLHFWDYPIPRDAYEMLDLVFWLIFATMIIFAVSVFRAPITKVGSLETAMRWAILEMFVVFLILITIISLRTGNNIISLYNVTALGEWASEYIQMLAAMLLAVHLIFSYELTRRI